MPRNPQMRTRAEVESALRPCLFTFGNGSMCRLMRSEHHSLTNHPYSEEKTDYVPKLYDWRSDSWVDNPNYTPPFGPRHPAKGGSDAA